MGYLDNSTITVDAILTKKGRELLAMGRGTANGFQISQFALADDEIDYDLWNPAHPLGSAYYGTVIENMPVTEAVPDETQSMKYKLITLPRGVAQIPIIKSDKNSITITNSSTPEDNTITISTYFYGVLPNIPKNENLFNKTGGYTAILLDTTYVTMGNGMNTSASPLNNPESSSTPATSYTVVLGNTESNVNSNTIKIVLSLRDRARTALDGLADVTKSTKLIVTGNETGGRVVIPITVKWVGNGTGI